MMDAIELKTIDGTGPRDIEVLAIGDGECWFTAGDEYGYEVCRKVSVEDVARMVVQLLLDDQKMTRVNAERKVREATQS